MALPGLRTVLAGATLVAALTLGALPAAANLLAIDYFKVLNNSSGSPDFGGSGTPNVAAGSALGPNGFPVVNSSSPGVSMFNAPTYELAWWSPSLSGNVVIADGTGTVSIPFNQSMYSPGGTGGDNASAFQTAVLSGSFTLSSPSIVSFTMGSDDDSFLYIDGLLVGQNPGIHGVSVVQFDSPTLSAGQHELKVFFADRARTGAQLSLNLVTQGITLEPSVATPEPATAALLLAGLLGTAALRRRQHLRQG